jgi:superfamily II DNA or RNA helicase
VTWPAPFGDERLDLLVSGRISPADAARQTGTAREILRRLAGQPGLVLADEVGMGKTFVALTVAVSAIWADRGARPVVVMVPPSVRDKWLRDWGVFQSRCIKRPEDRALRVESAGNALELFRLLDDPRGRQARMIFLTHGAFHRNLQDPWVKLAILKFALHHAKLGERRDALIRFAPDILRVKSAHSDKEMFRRLLKSGFESWRAILTEFGDDPGDDPVPEALSRALERSEIDLSAIRQRLLEVPLRRSVSIEHRLKDVRQSLNEVFQDAWRAALIEAKFRSPLLILDEAHHVKNPGTKLASLFTTEEAKEDAGMLAGALKGRFERMLFLTATPFQLGHHELLEVIERFHGIAWKTMPGERAAEVFTAQRSALRQALDEAQLAATDLDANWGKLRPSDVVGDGDEEPLDVGQWWETSRARPADQPERVQQVLRSFERARVALAAAGTLLQPWVIRHLRSRLLPSGQSRRVRLAGTGVITGRPDSNQGLPIGDAALLPFLLAARAQAIVGQIARAEHDRAVHYRATFAEGLASSYEAFLETRATPDADQDEPSGGVVPRDPRLERYLDRLRDSLPGDEAFAEHPKVAAVAERVCDLWARGEKSVVFCHYRITGRALVKHISRRLDARLWAAASERLQTPEEELRRIARAWNDGFEDDRPLERVLRNAVAHLISAHPDPGAAERERIVDIVRRFVRTESFLGRFVELTADDRAGELERVLGQDTGGQTLRARLDAFVALLLGRLTPDERAEYLEALERIHPGHRYEGPDPSESHGAAVLLPNVRLATGLVPAPVRRRLLLGFNTPFLPEILVASSVMAEGVDLHLNCRHILHHDLDWNPSVIEQRTGRVDRIGAKAEQVGRSIEVSLPYVGGTQDEKMYKVVMDRERWFQVVMGENYRTDEHSTEQAAQRVPLPDSIAQELTLRLEVIPPRSAD